MDENQFRIFIRLLEQVLRTLRHIEDIMVKNDAYREVRDEQR